MGRRLGPVLSAAGLCLALIVAPPPALADSTTPTRLVISNSNTDWGLAAPYLHARGGQGYMLTHYVFDNLVGQASSGALTPELASKWELSDDGLSVDVTVDPDARWHDGRDVTSTDVTFTFAYVTKHPLVFVSLENVAGTEVLSPDHLRISLHRPDAGFAASVLAGLPILPEHIYRDQTNPRRFTEPSAMIGSGPYRLSRHKRAKGLYVFSAVTDYYGAAQKYDEILIVKLQPEGAIQAATNGEVNVISDLPNRLVKMAKSNRLQVETAPSGNPVKLRFDHEGLFAVAQRRQALAHILNRQALADIAYRGSASVASLGYLQDNSAWYHPNSVYDYEHDPEKATELLSQSGWTRDVAGRWLQDGQPITLRLIVGGKEAALAQVLQDQLEAFGLEVAVRVLERGALREVAQGKDYDLILAGGSTLGDPVTALERVFGSNWNNERYKGDGALMKLAQAQAQSLDPDKRAALLAAFQHRYSRELPAIQLLNIHRTVAHDAASRPWFFSEGLSVGIPVAIHKYMFLED